jgi:bloom syndrome protein
VNIIALTATSTKDTFHFVCQSLSLKEPILVGYPPNRTNIYFEVQSLPNMEEFCIEVSEKLKSTGLEYPKTLVFHRNYQNCALMFHLLKAKLGPFITFPPHYPAVQEFLMVSMYTRASTKDMKEKVLSSFSANGRLRIVLATSAFGMGIDISDIRVIIHWGPPSNLEEYVQESGKAGRDSLPAKAILMYGKPGNYVNEEMRSYGCNSLECQRKLLTKDFLFSNNSEFHCTNDYCDICNCYI